MLEKKATLKEEKKSEAMAAGFDWESNDSDEEVRVKFPFEDSTITNLLVLKVCI